MALASGLAADRAAASHALARYRSEFPIFRDRIYLNTCSLGALGERTRRKVAEFLDVWQSRGASAWYDVWWAGLGDLRARYARLVGAAPTEIALAPSISVPVEAIARAVDDRTALVATSHVYFTSGAIQDIRAVADAAHARGALCLIDAYQSVGQVPVDVRAAGVDFLTAGGLKWLLGGTGIVFLYVRAE